MNYLKEIKTWTAQGRSFDEIVDGLHSRSDDECYSAYHWLETAAEKDGQPGMFPALAYRPGFYESGATPALILSHMSFPDGLPAELKELCALAVEHLYRLAKKPRGLAV
jgi:hypothetical protein